MHLKLVKNILYIYKIQYLKERYHETAMLKLEKELKKYIRKDVDSVIVFKSRSQKWLDKKFLGKIEKDKTDNFL